MQPVLIHTDLLDLIALLEQEQNELDVIVSLEDDRRCLCRSLGKRLIIAQDEELQRLPLQPQRFKRAVCVDMDKRVVRALDRKGAKEQKQLKEAVEKKGFALELVDDEEAWRKEVQQAYIQLAEQARSTAESSQPQASINGQDLYAEGKQVAGKVVLPSDVDEDELSSWISEMRRVLSRSAEEEKVVIQRRLIAFWRQMCTERKHDRRFMQQQFHILEGEFRLGRIKAQSMKQDELSGEIARQSQRIAGGESSGLQGRFRCQRIPKASLPKAVLG